MIPAWPPQATGAQGCRVSTVGSTQPGPDHRLQLHPPGRGCGTQKLGCQHFPQRELEEPGSGEPLSTSCSPVHKAELRSRDTPSSQSTASLSLKVRCSPVRSCRDLGPEVFMPRQSPPPCYLGPSVVCWPHHGASAGRKRVRL